MKTLIHKILAGLFFFVAYGCEQEEFFRDDLAGFDPDSDLAMYEIQLTGPGQSSGEIYWDLGTGKAYTYEDAAKQPEVVDLVLLWGSSTASNLVAPREVERLDGWGTGKKINEEWFVKNETYMVRLEKSEAGLELYNHITSMADVSAAYASLKTLAEGQDNYSVSLHGESMSLNNIDVGDVIGIRTSKGVYAIALVQSLATGNSGNLRVSLKLDKRNETTRDPLPSSENPELSEFKATGLSELDSSNVIDLATGQMWSVKDGYYNQNNADAIIYKGSEGVIFSAPSLGLPIVNEGVMELNSDWELRHQTQFIRLKASSETMKLYYEAFTNSLIQETFQKGADIVSAYDDYDQGIYGPGLSVSGLSVGDVVLYHSVARNTYGVIRITAAEANSITGKVKSNTFEKIEVAAPVLKEFTSTGAGSSTAAYVDFKTGKVYRSEAEGQTNVANIDIISVRGSSTGHNLFPTTNNAAASGWTAAWGTRMATWPNRNAADVYDLGITAEAWEIYHNLKQDESMWSDFQTAIAGVSSTQRLQPIGNKQIIFIHSLDRNLLIALKVMDTSTSTSITYRYKLIDL